MSSQILENAIKMVTNIGSLRRAELDKMSKRRKEMSKFKIVPNHVTSGLFDVKFEGKIVCKAFKTEQAARDWINYCEK